MGITNLMSVSDGLPRTFFCQKVKNRRFMKKQTDGKVLIYRQSRHFFFFNNMNKIILPTSTAKWRVKNSTSHLGKGLKKRKKSTSISKKIAAFSIVKGILYHFLLNVWTFEISSPRKKRLHFVKFFLLFNWKKPESVFKSVEIFLLPHYGDTKQEAEVSSRLKRHTGKN